MVVEDILVPARFFYFLNFAFRCQKHGMDQNWCLGITGPKQRILAKKND